jgi:hypothetical protein
VCSNRLSIRLLVARAAFAGITTIVLGAGGGCAGSRVAKGCPTVEGCESACCTSANQCEEVVCDGVGWVCYYQSNATYGWVRGAEGCPRDLGSHPTGDAAGKEAGGSKGDGASCTSSSCGANASCTSSGCACVQGYVNTNGSWSDGCEASDTACSAYSCGHCVKGYCGQHGYCKDDQKCRCSSGAWNNVDGDWSNGCEAASPSCSSTNCNECYTGYCGYRADCMQNKCACVVSGWASCDGEWEKTGCECNGTCSGSTCQ